MKKDTQHVIDIITEEKQQFLKLWIYTLNRDRNFLNRNIVRLGASRASEDILGDVAWRLYKTYGYPTELTVSIAEEKSLSFDTNG